MSPRDERALLPLGLRTPGSFASETGFVASEKSFEHHLDRLPLFGIKVISSLECHPESIVARQTLISAEHEQIRGDRKSGGQPPEHAQTRLGRSCFVAPELGDVDLDSPGQGDLGQSTRSAQLGESIGEGHDPEVTGSIEDGGDKVLYNNANQPPSVADVTTGKVRPMPDGVVPLDVAPEASDAELLDAVVVHWHERLLASDDCDSILSTLGISVDLAIRLRLGLSDRTLGNRLPDRRWKAGDALRSRLTAFGIMRDTGHEAFRGCVTVPVADSSGSILGLYGRRIDRSKSEHWATGLPGGIFHAGTDGEPMLVVGTITDALAVIETGHEAVVAPGRAKGFSKRDLSDLAASRSSVVVAGRGTLPLAKELASRGVSVCIAAPDVRVASLLDSAASRNEALASLLAESESYESSDEMGATASPGMVVPTPTTPEPANDGKDEVFFHTDARSWRIRGAGNRANAEGELLRVALSVTQASSGRFHLDTLDLYSARQRSAFLNAGVTELRVDRDVLATELAEVIGAAEQRRDTASIKATLVAPTMSEQERADAMAWLTDPDLLDHLSLDLAELGVVGEETNLLVAYLATISRLCERPFGVLVQSSSAAGKSTLSDAVCSLVPSEDLVSLSAITSQALYYLGGGDLAHKVLAVAEEQGASRASYALKLLVSEGRLSIASTGKDKSSGRLSTTSYEIAGPIALVMTTTSTDIDPELENRLVVLGVDEDATQTQAIVDAQRRAVTVDGLRARTTRHDLRQIHANVQRLLSPFPVVIGDIGAGFPATATRHRRDHAKLLSIISAVTLLHQHQRVHQTLTVGDTTVIYLEATADDVDRGMALARVVLMRGTDNLSPQAARLLQVVLDHANEEAEELGCDPVDVSVTRRQLRGLLGWSDMQIRAATDRLVALEYLVVAGGGRGRCRTYSYVPDMDQVGGQDGPVGAPGAPTSQPSSPGETDEFVQLVGLGETRITAVHSIAVSDRP
jgi:DNA primase